MISQKEFRKFSSLFTSAVTVVATQTPEGELYGTLSSSVASVSRVPPLYLVCVDQKSNALLSIVRAGAFSINVLQKCQTRIASAFASKRRRKFEGIKYGLGALGMPRLDQAIAVIECKLIKNIQIADHALLVGLVETSTFNDGEALVHPAGKLV